ncbi:GPP34 family phosphoprotein [Corynebacterium genitalium ATCC 33030]|uniref:Uncharacterized protein n=1 Tax=Corynebacterium genitalium ATCC 33030 TaxID=585529 RepID=D7W9N7_9CORY|nr:MULTISPECIES: GPP34 family phosphoprotein [Corynebacterium]EFK55517.1 hypothetical protein HMPREF0291_10775 [Corynebacterium genitalium ATCC 33030]MCQ4621586.1 GPP34 family phosphoprotein [Corynebacterium sp. CCUG 71335]MCQ4623280.1 GPP34 family phosphoprotein [Corynebacterium sp. CCUG 70398]MCQ4624996.1 GPP34 family phosphoprotein [Corynebacterium sp. CCUG 69979]UUA89252.1 GPP34 family phosphoprotein [Corynebacterium genitalium ATCC 33030]
MLVSEALFLLLSDKSAHVEVGVSHQRVALNGALLCDLVATGLVDVHAGKSPSVSLVNGAVARSEGHPALAHGVARVEKKGHPSVYSLLNSRKFAKKEAIAQRLIEEGVLDEERAGFLGLHWQRFPEKDETIEKAMRQRYRDIFLGKEEPRPEEAMVILLLKNTGELRRQFLGEIEGIPFNDLRMRVKQIDRQVLDAGTFENVDGINTVLLSVASAAAVEEAAASS